MTNKSEMSAKLANYWVNTVNYSQLHPKSD